jgi:SpoVK/Ycf46/Vps4 family AAA+-type ATPase
MSMNESKHVKNIIMSILVLLLWTIVGVVLNHISNMLTNSMYNLQTSSKNMNSYERQIHENIINPENISETLKSIGGLSNIKEDIRANVLLPLQYPKVFFSTKSQLTPSKGILLYGPPGTGKTLLAKAIASSANVPFFSLALSTLENKYYGESAKLIKAVFSLARKLQPCIVFFDEIDGLLRKRSDFDQSSTYGFKTELLSQIDGMESNATDSIIVIGTTNCLDSLDPAIRRRLPKVYRVELPNESERYEILMLKTEHEDTCMKSVNSWVASVTNKFSGSDLTELVRQASSFRLQEQCADELFQQQLQDAVDVVDMPNLISLCKHHFQKALSRYHNIDTKSETEDEHDEEDYEEDEESPPDTQS